MRVRVRSEITRFLFFGNIEEPRVVEVFFCKAKTLNKL